MTANSDVISVFLECFKMLLGDFHFQHLSKFNNLSKVISKDNVGHFSETA